jgi:hypothetical protein
MGMVGKLEELRVLTVAEVVRRGADELGQLCGLKVGPKVRLEKALKRVAASGDVAEVPVVVATPTPTPVSAELFAVIE